MDSTQNGAAGVRQIVQEGDVKAARKITTDFNRWVTSQREGAVVENIINTKNWAPTFYAGNKQEIDALDLKKPHPSDSLINKYVDYLETLSPEERDQRARADNTVYAIPERQAPPTPEELARLRQERDQKLQQKPQKQQQQKKQQPPPAEPQRQAS
jgi:hypothetical protein